jgi:hypothetical protein
VGRRPSGCGRTPRAADSPEHGRFSTLEWDILLSSSGSAVPAGARLTQTVGLAALVVCSSSSAPERSPLRAALRSRRAPHATAHAICARRPPPRSCQPPCVLHSRRVCFAVARLGASPLPARLGTVHSCRARPCTCTAKVAALDACRPKDATPAAPPNTCCSRPPSRCDFPSQRMPTARGGSHRSPRRAAAERHR